MKKRYTKKKLNKKKKQRGGNMTIPATFPGFLPNEYYYPLNSYNMDPTNPDQIIYSGGKKKTKKKRK
jgi:hypothetical protein